MQTCGSGFIHVGRALDFDGCNSLNPFGYLRSPLHLQHWTMAVVEVLLMVGAAVFVWLGVYRARRDHDATLLCFLGASIAYLLTMEVPGAYFPDLMGASPADVPFVHNRFSIGFLFDRLPLYIVALYLALPGLAFVIVERADIFARRHGLLVASVCVGFLHHAFYEIFDQFGPQYHWWAWNYDLKYMAFSQGSVPMVSLLGFSMLGPFVFTLLVQMTVIRPLGRGHHSVSAVVSRTVAAGVVAAIALSVLMAPIFGLALLAQLGSGWRIVASALCYLVVAIFGVLTVRALQSQSLVATAIRSPQGGYAILYLVVFAGLWIYALPDYFGAANGETRLGTPVGSLPYVIGCYAFLGYALWRCFGVSTAGSGVQPMLRQRSSTTQR